MPNHRAFIQPAVAAAAPSPHIARRYACLLLCGLSLGLITTASAEELSVDEMACALDPQCTTPVVDHRLRGITTTPSVRTPGSFDRTVNFAFDSAELTSDARKELDAVAESLSRPNVARFDIVINGHTDAVGSPEYNQKLSERRAQAVRQYLITQGGIDAGRLVARGYGKDHLLLPSEPSNELNRRVEFRNPNYVAASAPQTKAPVAARPAASPAGKPAASPAAGNDGF